MTRYLLFISYIGTQFRGVQKQIVNAELPNPDHETVQGILELCSKLLKPVNEPRVSMSSRTDRGVHALLSSAHVDLERASGLTYDPSRITACYNRYFVKAKLDLRVQSAHIVPDTFHARHSVKSRTYLYRLAVRNPDAPPKKSYYMTDIPFIEWNRCHFIQKVDKFDVSLMKTAAALFPGTRDFRTFMNNHSNIQPGSSTIRHMYRLDVTPGTPLLGAKYSSICSHYTFWDITCQASSFLYRQIRRIVGALISVAEGRISVGDIQYMLDNPSKDSWNNRIEVVPPHGLYLIKVDYDPLEMVVPLETVEQDHKNDTQIRARKSCLHSCETVVTNVSGHSYKEKILADGTSVMSQLQACTSPGYVVDTKPDVQVALVLPGLCMGSQDVAQDIDLLKRHAITHILSLGIKPIIQDKTLIYKSSSVVIAYLMKKQGMSYQQAFLHLKERRTVIKPNPGFVQQLKYYEQMIVDCE